MVFSLYKKEMRIERESQLTSFVCQNENERGRYLSLFFRRTTEVASSPPTSASEASESRESSSLSSLSSRSSHSYIFTGSRLLSYRSSSSSLKRGLGFFLCGGSRSRSRGFRRRTPRESCVPLKPKPCAGERETFMYQACVRGRHGRGADLRGRGVRERGFALPTRRRARAAPVAQTTPPQNPPKHKNTFEKKKRGGLSRPRCTRSWWT